MSETEQTASAPNARQRLDKWLWYARIVKTRTLAQKLVESGVVRVDSNRITSPSYKIGVGMVITMTVHERLRILEVRDPGTRRGPATEAQALYVDHSPELPRQALRPAMPGKREEGAGRPTKKERRQIDRLKGEG